jgi:hypothetical protein
MTLNILYKISKLFFCSLIIIVSVNCQNDLSEFSSVTKLSKLVSESSGLEVLSAIDGFWTINDAGNSNELFLFDMQGEIKQVVEVYNTKNKDWEALASDGDSMLYIGDFGNNNNTRKGLTIYGIDVNTIKNDKVKAFKTTFSYEDQVEFPPKKKDRNFDAEAFIYFNDHFYIFSKNRSSNFDGTTKLYKVSAEPGERIARLVGKFKTCDSAKNCAVTGADISDNGKQLVLLTHNSIYLFSDYKDDHFFDGKNTRIKLMHNSQKEGICFVGNTLYFTDESTKKSRCKLYKLEIKN